MSGEHFEAVRRTPAEIPDGPIRRRLMNAINLMDNNMRGLMAEVLVAEAVGAADGAEAWAPWDVTTPDGVKVEVKSSGFIQSWVQERRSAPAFDIAPKSRLQTEDGGHWPNPLHGERRRWSDMYVFCLHDGRRPDVQDEWTFFVVATSQLDAVCGDQKKITLGSLTKRLDPARCGHQDLRSVVRQASELDKERTRSH